VDFDLHGLAGVRVEDGTPADVDVVARQLGPLPRRLGREPDITIRFVDRLEPSTRLRYLGARDAGWADDGFYVLRSRKKPAMVRLPINQIGEPCEIVCERGLPAVPYLIAMLNLAVLTNGALPIHAAAFELDGRGVLVTGWSKGGKTELLMAATRAGARYIGDEWVYLTADGQMFGIPEPVRLWDWHLDQLPEVRRRLGRTDRVKLRLLPLAGRFDAAVPRAVRRSLPGRTLSRAVPVIDMQRHVDLPPERLFGPLGPQTGRLDHVLFVVAAAGDSITVEDVDPSDVARSMQFSLLHERLDLATLYLQARFAFPDLANPHLDGAETVQRARLTSFLAGRPAHRIVHPYPVDFAAFLDAARRVL
jgi:NAD(P)-dependent dehydrogenase (short-subunit alcohol dehydrogenase family)